MEGEVLAPKRKVPYRGLGAATVASALGALLLNLALGRALVAGMPEDADEAAPVEAPVEGEAPASPDGAPAPVAGVAGGVESLPEEGGDGEAGGVASLVGGARVTEATYREIILGRNLFDAARIGAGEEEDCPEGEDCGGFEASLSLSAMLTGTVVSDVPSFSAAFLLEDGKNSAVAYGIGQELQGAQLVEIQKERVLFRKGELEQWLVLGQKSESKGASSSAAPTADGGAAPVEGGVTKNSDTSFTIDKALWDGKMADLTSLTREARALQHRGPDGNYDGYRLSAIRRGSLADNLGIKNGDIVHSINGLVLDSVDNAMKAFDTMRSDSNFKIEVTRRGQPVTLEYGIK